MTEGQMAAARAELAAQGLWCETSAAAVLGGLRSHGPRESEGPVVCVVTSSGYKDIATARETYAPMDTEWPSIKAALTAAAEG
ncbi:hypothetical protein [Streptomyces zaomyceticus]|uniref:hypothetical protein n=1 Tax=Streptomyces zaomyceticus TaxID=68286 RepID=UPI0037A44609